MKTAPILLPGMLALVAILSHAEPSPLGAQTAVTRTDKVNVRALPSKQSEVLASLPKGQPVTVLGTTNGAPEDATTWTEIALPEQVGVWVYGPLIDSKKSVVRAKTANLRAGPGTNYSEMGEVAQGAPITIVRKVDEWYQISAPAGSHAYVAGNLLEPVNASGAAAAVTDTAVKRVSPVIEPLAVAPPITRERITPLSGTLPPDSDPRVAAKKKVVEEAPKVEIDQAPPRTQEVPPGVTAVAVPAAAAAVVAPGTITTTTTTTIIKPASYDAVAPITQPPVIYNDQVRQVYREGVVARSFNPKTPSFYELRSMRSGEGLQDYLITDDPNVVLKTFKGRHVVVTGEEYVDPNYGKVPIIRVKSIKDAP